MKHVGSPAKLSEVSEEQREQQEAFAERDSHESQDLAKQKLMGEILDT